MSDALALQLRRKSLCLFTVYHMLMRGISAHDIAISKQHKSISASDVLKALEAVEFGDLVDPLQKQLKSTLSPHSLYLPSYPYMDLRLRVQEHGEVGEEEGRQREVCCCRRRRCIGACTSWGSFVDIYHTPSERQGQGESQGGVSFCSRSWSHLGCYGGRRRSGRREGR